MVIGSHESVLAAVQREKLERFGNVTKEKGLANVIVQGKMKRNEEKLLTAW